MIEQEIDWEQRRYEIAKTALAQLMSTCPELTIGTMAENAVALASILIEELRRPSMFSE